MVLINIYYSPNKHFCFMHSESAGVYEMKGHTLWMLFSLVHKQANLIKNKATKACPDKPFRQHVCLQGSSTWTNRWKAAYSGGLCYLVRWKLPSWAEVRYSANIARCHQSGRALQGGEVRVNNAGLFSFTPQLWVCWQRCQGKAHWNTTEDSAPANNQTRR